MSRVVLLLTVFTISLTLSAQVTFNGNGNNGFGGVLGTGNFEISDDGTTVTITFTKGSGNFDDALVIYIDSEAGGFSNTSNFTDTGDELRSAISGYDGTNRSTVNFPPGFNADFAVAAKPTLSSQFGGLWELVQNGGHSFIKSVNLTPNNSNNSATYTMTFDFADINSAAGSSAFSFVVTYLNPSNSFRSDEAIGGGIASGNPGASPVTFTTYFEYSSGNKGGTATTAASGNWTDVATWINGNVPLEGDEVQINHSVTLNQDATVSDISIASGITFTASDGNARTLAIADGGSITNNGTFTASDGIVDFAGGGTVSGAISFNNVAIAGGVDFGASSTISNQLTIQAGGFVNSNPPTYGPSSTLVYNTGGTYGRGAGWSATSGSGYPNNVTLSNNTTLSLGANGGTGTARQCAGNLTVDAGSALSLNEATEQMTAALTVLGDFINNGTVTLSGLIGGDLVLQGNFDDNGNFNANGRAVFFEGSNTQNINSSTDPLEIDVMRINKGGGQVVMNQNLLVDETADPLQFGGTSSVLNLNGYKLTIGKTGVTSAISMASGAAIAGSSTSDLEILGDGALGTIIFDNAYASLDSLVIDRGASGTVAVKNDLQTQSLVVTNGTLTIDGNATLTINGNYTNNGTVTITDGSSVLMDAATTISGDMTVQRTGTPYSNIYNYWSSPVNGVRYNQIWDFGTGSTQYNSTDLYAFDSVAQTWRRLDTNALVAPGKGFAMTGPVNNKTATNTISFTGAPNNGFYAFPLHYNVDADSSNDWNLVGNPYPSAIKVDALFANNGSSTIAGTLYFWDLNYTTINDTGTSADYATRTASAGTASRFNTEQPDEYIGTAQGFFVRARNNSGLIFNNAQRTSGNNTQFFKTGDDYQRIWIEAYTDQRRVWNHLAIVFGDDCTDGYDNLHDGMKLKGNPDIAFYSKLNGEDYAIQGLAPLDGRTKTVPLGLDAGKAGTYTIAIDSIDGLDPGVGIYLHDVTTGTYHDLRQGPFTFYVPNDQRKITKYALVFNGQPVSVAEAIEPAPWHAYTAAGTLHIRAYGTQQLTHVRLIDMQGRVVARQQVDGPQARIGTVQLPAGLYVVEAGTATGIHTQKIIIP